jgi:hypothetical protein
VPALAISAALVPSATVRTTSIFMVPAGCMFICCVSACSTLLWPSAQSETRQHFTLARAQLGLIFSFPCDGTTTANFTVYYYAAMIHQHLTSMSLSSLMRICPNLAKVSIKEQEHVSNSLTSARHMRITHIATSMTHAHISTCRFYVYTQCHVKA